MMLSDEARGDANPILLIEEFEVTAGHAASAGQLDEQQLYYLMSRGLPRQEAEFLVESSVQYKEVRKEVKQQSDTPPAPLPGHTTAEVNVGGDTGGDHKAEVRFSTSA